MAGVDFPTIVNKGLQYMGIAFEVKRKAQSDGDCLYDSTLAVAFEDPAMRATLSGFTNRVTDIKSLRRELATFMKTCPQLHAIILTSPS